MALFVSHVKFIQHYSVCCLCVSVSTLSLPSLTQQEDEELLRLCDELNTRNWPTIAEHMPGRTVRQCRSRYFALRPEEKVERRRAQVSTGKKVKVTSLRAALKRDRMRQAEREEKEKEKEGEDESGEEGEETGAEEA